MRGKVRGWGDVEVQHKAQLFQPYISQSNFGSVGQGEARGMGGANGSGDYWKCGLVVVVSSGGE